MKVTIRMDDITPDMNWQNFNRVTKMLEERGIYPLLGVVPDNHDEHLAVMEPREEFVRIIKEKQRMGYTISMHGATHVYTTKCAGIFPLNCFSEFAGVPYEEQKRILEDAKNRMESMGLHTSLFMAPGHTLDENTLKVLKELGFSYVTDGFGTAPYQRKGMIFLPIALQKKKVFKNQPGMTTIVLHVNAWQESDFEDFEKMIVEHSANFVSYQEWFSMEEEKRTLFGLCREFVQAKGKWMMVRLLEMRKGR